MCGERERGRIGQGGGRENGAANEDAKGAREQAREEEDGVRKDQ